MTYLHRRQWVLGPEPLLARPDWHTQPVASGVHLSWDPALPVAFGPDRALLGIAAQTEEGRPRPAEELAGTPQPDTWTGRFVLVDGGRVITDAGATMSVFHREVDGARWASSSPAILRAMAPALGAPAFALVAGGGMDWYPAPGSGIAGLRRLLPSQALVLPSGDIDAYPLLPPVVHATSQEVLDRLQGRLVRGLQALAEPGPLGLALTAGKDSRLVVAAAVAAGIDAETYTFGYPGIAQADVELPPRLSREAGFEHRFIPAGKREKAAYALWDEHTAGHSVELDRHFYGRGQLQQLTGYAADVGGSLFDVPVAAWYQEFEDSRLPPSPEATTALVLDEMPSPLEDQVLEWARWMFAHPQADLDWRDRFALEQRVAGWIGSIMQGLDLGPTDAMHIANCRAYLSDTLALPVLERFDGRHQLGMVARLAPGMAAEPVNPPSALPRRLAARARRELIELRIRPWPHQYLGHRMRRLQRRREAAKVVPLERREP